MNTDTPSLTSRETAVLSWADRFDHTAVTTREIGSVVGDTHARSVASSLAKKGLLQRVSKGVYRVQPLGAVANPRVRSSIAAAALAAGGMPYYIGGRTAASLHRLTTQRYTAVIDLYTPKRIRPRQLGSAALVIHPVAPAMLEFGTKRMIIDDVAVTVSDPERTFIDLLDRTVHLLGFAQTRNILHHNLGTKLNTKRLVTYARRWPKSSTARRLGVLLELEGVDERVLAPLSKSLRASRSDAVLEPGGARRGSIHPRFRVIMNSPTTNGPAL